MRIDSKLFETLFEMLTAAVAIDDILPPIAFTKNGIVELIGCLIHHVAWSKKTKADQRWTLLHLVHTHPIAKPAKRKAKFY